MHTLLDLRGTIPSFIHISDGKLHDVHALDMLVPEAGAIYYIMDRGYVDFARLHGLQGRPLRHRKPEWMGDGPAAPGVPRRFPPRGSPRRLTPP